MTFVVIKDGALVVKLEFSSQNLKLIWKCKVNHDSLLCNSSVYFFGSSVYLAIK